MSRRCGRVVKDPVSRTDEPSSWLGDHSGGRDRFASAAAADHPRLLHPVQPCRSIALASSTHQQSTWAATARITPAGELLHQKWHTQSYVRRGRYLSSVPYDCKTDACYQCCHLLLISGDIEVNPGPITDGADGAAAQENTLTLYHANVRSLKKQLGTLRTHATVLQN